MNETSQPDRSALSPEQTRQQARVGATTADPQIWIDPVCGMTVTDQTEHRYLHRGRDFYFCSAECQSRFAANPARYSAPFQPTRRRPPELP